MKSSPTLIFEYTEGEGGRVHTYITYSLDIEGLISHLFDTRNQVAVRSSAKNGSLNRVLFRGILMHSIIFHDGRIFDSTGFCWREDLAKKGSVLRAEWKKF